jgi:hypothetical protein
MPIPATQHILVAVWAGLDDQVGPTVRALAADPHTRVEVVVPGRDSRAEQRLLQCVRELKGLGLEAHGHVGAPDPVAAIERALADFPATELVVASDTDRLVDHVLARFGLPTVRVPTASRSATCPRRRTYLTRVRTGRVAPAA